MNGQTVAALRRLGFDDVFDTQFGADLTIMEEGSEFVEAASGRRAAADDHLLLRAWMKFIEQFYPDLLENISTAKSPMSIVGA